MPSILALKRLRFLQLMYLNVNPLETNGKRNGHGKKSIRFLQLLNEAFWSGLIPFGVLQLPWRCKGITLFISITVHCGIENISWNIL